MQRSNDENPEYGAPRPVGLRDSRAPKPWGVNRREVLTRLIALPLVGATAGCATSADARHATQFWDEEVQLADGRIIWVQQGRGLSRISDGLTRYPYPTLASLKFFLPGVSPTVIEWSDRFKPLNLNVHDGELYVAGQPFLERHWFAFDKPRSGWVVQRYIARSKVWDRTPASLIPEPIRATNLLMAEIPNASWPVMSLSIKNASNFNGAASRQQFDRQLDPTVKAGLATGFRDTNLKD